MQNCGLAFGLLLACSPCCMPLTLHLLLPACAALGQPVRSSSGSLGAAPAGGLGAAIAAGQGAAGAAGAAAAAAAAGAGGRGAGPDHREVRYADGVLAMINVLRLLTLGGPRTWDAGLHKQVGWPAAGRQGWAGSVLV